MSDETERELLIHTFSCIIEERCAVELTNELMERFGTLTAMVEAMPFQEDTAHVPESIGTLLSMIPHIHKVRSLERLGEHPKLNTLCRAQEYVSALYAGVQYEQIALLCLDENLCLIECCPMNEGSLKEVAFYPRRLLQKTLSHRAKALILCHNHPSNWVFFSEADVTATQELIELCQQNRIALLDHLLIAGERISSMRCRTYISEKDWRAVGEIVPSLAEWRAVSAM